ncbi:MAG: hypothetical protein HY326_13580 [Chloroflexi bacterium]|nr:hypothetical protein [Chloroflexota bacterium]
MIKHTSGLCSRCGYARPTSQPFTSPCIVCGSVGKGGNLLPLVRLSPVWTALVGFIETAVLGLVLLAFFWYLGQNVSPSLPGLAEQWLRGGASRASALHLSPGEYSILMRNRPTAHRPQDSFVLATLVDPKLSLVSPLPKTSGIPGLSVSRQGIQKQLDAAGFTFGGDFPLANKDLFPRALQGQPILWGKARDSQETIGQTWVYLVGPPDNLALVGLLTINRRVAQEKARPAQLRYIATFLQATLPGWTAGPAWVNGCIAAAMNLNKPFAHQEIGYQRATVDFWRFREDSAIDADLDQYTFFVEITPQSTQFWGD